MHPRHLISTLILLLFLTFFSFLYVRLNSQILYLQAANRIQEGDYHIAVDHLKKAVQKQPNDPLFWKGLGNAYQNLGKSTLTKEAFDSARKSEQAYLKATLLNPLDAEAFYGLARETARLEKLNAFWKPGEGSGPYNALPIFQKTVRLRPGGLLYHYALARYLHRHRKSNELLKVVRTLSRIYPPSYHNRKNEAFWSPKLREASKNGMLQALEKTISPRKNYMTLSSLLTDEKDWTNAISYYQKAMNFQSMENNSGDFYHLGRLYLENRQLIEAEGSFITALSMSPDREKDLERIYRSYAGKNYFGELHQLYVRAGKSYNLSSQIYVFLARSLIDQKQYDPAKQTLVDANQNEPTAEAYYWLSRIAEIEKDWDSMELAIQKATVLDQTNSRYHLIFSQVLKRLNKLERAEKAAGQAIKHSTKPSPGLFNHRAWIRWKRSNFIGAAEDWQTAIGLNPFGAAYHAHAAEANAKSGKLSSAIKQYQTAMDLDPKNAGYQKRYNELKSEQKSIGSDRK